MKGDCGDGEEMRWRSPLCNPLSTQGSFAGRRFGRTSSPSADISIISLYPHISSFTHYTYRLIERISLSGY